MASCLVTNINRYIVAVEYFPLTDNGKLDRKALPDPEDVIDQDRHIAAVPSTEGLGDMLLPESAPTTMVDYILNVIHQSRGYRPHPGASFAAIGVDSLGAVLFLRSLSESLGSVHISPSEMYSPGVTVKSFANNLHARLSAESPEVLHRKGILSVDEEVGSHCEDSDHESDCEQSVTLQFDNAVLSNMRLVEGLRGALSVLVLWDHLHGKNNVLNDVWRADTSLFVLLSGFTTTLQLRPTRIVSTTRDAYKTWKWQSFLFSRFIGVFPLLWLALVFNAPRWYYFDIWMQQHGHVKSPPHRDSFGRYGVDPSVEAECTFLYVIAMQQWNHAKCAPLGPYDVYYASVIWNCYLIYAALRIILDKLQKYFRLHWAPETLCDKSTLSPRLTPWVEFTISWFDNNLNWGPFMIISTLWMVLVGVVFQLLKVRVPCFKFVHCNSNVS